MEHLNLSYTIICNASLPGATFVDPAPPIPPSYLQAIAVIVYTTLSILTVGGNALVCVIVFHYMGMITVTNLFIANLALTDLFIGLFCIPIVLISDYLLADWPFGKFMCKFTSFAQSVFVVCTVYTLVSMSVDRYIAIIHPLNPKLTHFQCRLLIGFLWLFALLFSSPIFIEMSTRNICFHLDHEYSQTTCESMGLSSSLQTAYNLITITVIYLIPVVVLSIIYIRLGWQLHRTRAPGEAHSERDAKIKKSKQKVIKMCFVIVIMFGVCWLPMQLYTNVLRERFDRTIDHKYVPHIYFAFHLMAMSNSCVNPAIYAVMSSKFRAGFLHYWHCMTACCYIFNFRIKHQRESTESQMRSSQRRPCRQSLGVINNDGEQYSNTSMPCFIPLMDSQRPSILD